MVRQQPRQTRRTPPRAGGTRSCDRPSLQPFTTAQSPQIGKQYGAESIWAAKLIKRVRKRIVGPLPCPIFRGPSAGALSIANSADMLQQKVRTFRKVDSGTMRLESDQYIGGRWVTVADAPKPRRVELLTDLAHDVL